MLKRSLIVTLTVDVSNVARVYTVSVPLFGRIMLVFMLIHDVRYNNRKCYDLIYSLLRLTTQIVFADEA